MDKSDSDGDGLISGHKLCLQPDIDHFVPKVGSSFGTSSANVGWVQWDNTSIEIDNVQVKMGYCQQKLFSFQR